mgnify:CR=1 FL=1
MGNGAGPQDVALLNAMSLPNTAKGQREADAIAEATKLRDAALKDDTAWNVLESLTTEIGPRLARLSRKITVALAGRAL